MASEINHDTIKTRIVDILQANTALFTTTAEEGKLRSIEVGFPQGEEMQDKMFPYLFVTNSPGSPETIVNFGAVINNETIALQHSFSYDIITVVDEADSRKAELLLDNIQELVLETLEEDYNLTGAGSAVVDSSLVTRVQPFKPETRGEGKTGRLINLRCVATTGGTAATIGEISEFINNDEFNLVVGSDTYIGLEDLQLGITRLEDRAPTNDSGATYSPGQGNNFFTARLKATSPELSSLNTLTQVDADGELTSTNWLIQAKDVSSTTMTFAATGYLRDFFPKKGPDGKVIMDIFVRITGDIVIVI